MKALITGASSGMGHDMAIVLANIGIDLILVGRNEERLKKTANSLKNRVDVTYLVTDLSIEKNCYKLYQDTKDKNVDILINNAGFGDCGDFYKTSLTKDIDMIKTNVIAPHILTKLFLRDFVKNDNGYILNVASSASFLAGPEMATYYATKSYVYRLSEAVYEELRQKNSNVQISILCPGPVKTNFNETANVKFEFPGLNSMDVSRYAINEMLAGKLIIIPGKMMKALFVLERFVPERLLLKVTYKTQRRKIYQSKLENKLQKIFLKRHNN